MTAQPERRSPRGHRRRSHTADVIVEAWGSDFAECCEEAIAGLLSVCTQSSRAVVVGSTAVQVRAGTNQDLLSKLLDEVIFTMDTTADAVVEGRVEPTAHDDGLDVVLSLAKRSSVEYTGSAPKAIARSGLVVEHRGDRVWCSFLVDV